MERLLSKHRANDSKTAEINAKDDQGRSPLMVACAKGHEAIARLLLDYGASADMDVDEESHSTLYYAVRQGISESLVKRIYDATGSVSTLGDIQAVFFLASELGFTDIVQKCLSETPAIEVEGLSLARCSYRGRIALHIAAQRGFRQIVCLLLGAITKSKNDNDDELAVLDAKDDDGNTPLGLAALEGKDGIVELLLDRGANPRLTMEQDRTVVNLVAAASRPCTEGHIASVKRFLSEGVDPNAADEDRKAPLHWAATHGKIDLVDVLLTHSGIIPIDPLVKARWGWNAIHCAADSDKPGALKIIKMLMEAGTDPLLADADGWTPMHLAARGQHVDAELLQLLWEQDRGSLETRSLDGRTALHFAVREHLNLAWLLKRGSEVNAVDRQGQTALMWAARLDSSADAARVLLKNGADPMHVDLEGKTGLQLAAHAGSVRVGEALLRFSGRDTEKLVSYKDQDNCSALHIAIHDREPEFAKMLLETFYAKATGAALDDLNAVRKSNGDTPLLSAVRHCQGDVIAKLLGLGADTEARDKKGHTALLVAIHYGGISDVTILNILLDPKAKTRAKVNAGGVAYPTALSEAAYLGKRDLVEELVKLGADVNQVGGMYQTPLTTACFGGLDIVDFLLKQGAVQKIPGSDPPVTFTALHAAIFLDMADMISLLLEADEEAIGYQDYQGRTPVEIAVRMGSRDTVGSLLSVYYFTTGHRDNQGRSLFHHAVLSHNAELVGELLELAQVFEIDLNTPDADGWTPLHWACCMDDNQDVVAALMEVPGQGDDALLKATKDGWTPENICAFYDSGSTKAFVDKELMRIRESRGEEKGDNQPLPEVLVSEDTTSLEGPTEAPNPPEPTKRRWKTGYRHTTATCDGCMLPIVGVRWRCSVCQDFDFCFKCFWTAEKSHPPHEFIKKPEGGDNPVRNPELEDESDEEVAEESLPDSSDGDPSTSLDSDDE